MLRVFVQTPWLIYKALKYLILFSDYIDFKIILKCKKKYIYTFNTTAGKNAVLFKLSAILNASPKSTPNN